jgi:hypothetical protein
MFQVFKQNGLEQYNPEGQKFDPNLHRCEVGLHHSMCALKLNAHMVRCRSALFEVPDPSKEVGTVGAVTKVCSLQPLTPHPLHAETLPAP